MPIYIALLRAINVGGTGMLAMKELALLCSDLGLQHVRTYIQSGNIVFESSLAEKSVRTKLEQVLAAKMGKKIDVFVRTLPELQRVVDANPFPDGQPARVQVVFLSDLVAKAWVQSIISPGGEQVRAGRREIYIHYPNGMGQSKLKLPPVDGAFTARNMNTVARLVAIAAEIESAPA